ncbi:hypothetical protein HYH03_010354 [Edaphochlamys debaryana]|uniref:Uncharacterized protein n=1 Tax=Edaphochlamys debaryana TaxID=47281 RepID=A0A835XWW8_9CHLO|nr:hypothetical protein HYH03_010354 [Edaphochlamys debaryana]|eukprot:KAG2491355.1 hypothetical protein HYH03_010354 [Edaphochlamys debaryana]
MVAPGLHRAIASATSPFGGFPAAEALRSLEVYLSDSRSTDTVYESLINRACTEPLSAALVERVLTLLKACVLRFPPSLEQQQRLDEFAAQAAEAEAVTPAGRRAAGYLRACLRQLRGDGGRGMTASRGSMGNLSGGGSTGNLRSLWGRSTESLTKLADTRGLRDSGRRSAAEGAGAVENGSSTGPALSPSGAGPTGGGAWPPRVPAWMQGTEGPSELAAGGRGWEELGVPAGQAPSGPAEPAWAVPSRPLLLPPPPPGATAARAQGWLQHLPDLAPRPAPVTPGPGSPPPAAPAAPVTLEAIHVCVLDLEPYDMGRHLMELLREARAEAQQASTPVPQAQGRAAARAAASAAGDRPGGAHGGGGAGAHRGLANRRAAARAPARLLFHHPPYNRSEPLPMLEGDVAVVVEAVCGVRAAGALGPGGTVAAAAARAADEAAAAAGLESAVQEGMWAAAFDEEPELAQMCGSILMKLLVDLWLRAGPVPSYTLVLRMLRAALRSPQHATRARAFDVLYNLSLHGAMLRGAAEEAALAAAAVAGAGAGGAQMPWQVCASAPVSPFTSAGGGLTPPPPPRPPASPSPFAPPSAPTPTPAAPRHVPSHSLGLGGSGLLDSHNSMSAHAATIAALGGKGSATGVGAGFGSGSGAGAAAGTGSAATGAGAGAGAGMGPPPLTPVTPVGRGSRTAEGEPSGAGVMTSSGGAGAGGGADGFSRWLRALLFQLLCDLTEAAEPAEAVWAAALGATSQLCTHGGCWVAARVAALPPQALAGLLRAALNLGWSAELYAALLGLLPQVLLPQAAAAAASAAAAAGGGPGGNARAGRPATAFAAPSAHDAAATDGAAGGSVAARLAAFGGLPELLHHFMRAPTPDSRAAALTALAYACCPSPGGGGPGGMGALGSPQRPTPGSGAGGGAGGGGGGASPAGSREGGPAAVLALLSGLHLDSACLALRAALQRPWPGMSSRLADVLASAAVSPDPLAPAAPALTLSSAAAAAAATLPAGVASPIAARALLRPLLEALEAACEGSMAPPESGELRQHMETTLAHIGGPSGGPGAPKGAAVAAAWHAFKAVCSEESAEDRQAAIHWLHRLLAAAVRASQGQVLNLSPLALKTAPDALKASAAAAPATAAAAAAAQPWSLALADALLHVVREAPLGCELLLAAIGRLAADAKAAAAAAAGGPDAPLSPRLGLAGLAGVGGGADAAQAACRVVMSLYYVALQWVLQCGSAEARLPAVVELADTVLAALLQPPPTAAGLAAAAAAAAADGADGSGDSVSGGADRPPLPPPRIGSGAVGGASFRGGGAAAAPAVSSAAAAAASAAAAVEALGGGLLVSQQLLAGLLAFDADALAVTPPELLVVLLQQAAAARSGDEAAAAAAAFSSAHPNLVSSSADADGGGKPGGGGEGGFKSARRGFLGRPCAVAGGSPYAAGVLGRKAAAGAAGQGAMAAGLAGAAVGPWRDDSQDRRLALLLLLIARCSLDPEAFARYSLSHVVRAQLACEDLRCRYYAGVYLLKHWMLNQHDKYWRSLRHVLGTAQQLNDERLLDNPYLQVAAMLNVDVA